MKDFPEFMKNDSNHIDIGQQNTNDIDGYYYTANDGSQMAFWTCNSDQVSKPHQHPFVEYIVVVSGHKLGFEVRYVQCISIYIIKQD